MAKRALLSVWNKTGIVELGRELERLGYDILSTGGTFRVLEEAGVTVTAVSEVTGFPEILGGRVKTLHPAIHGGILARRKDGHLSELAAQDIATIDLVVVNLYPFEKTVADADISSEHARGQIDIGGPCMLRAAAKNYLRVAALCEPADYQGFLAVLKEGHGTTTLQDRFMLARKVFAHTAAYDAAIASYFASQTPGDIARAYQLDNLEEQ